jgi:hypothetical protein
VVEKRQRTDITYGIDGKIWCSFFCYFSKLPILLALQFKSCVQVTNKFCLNSALLLSVVGAYMNVLVSMACSTPYSADFIHNSHVFSLDCSTPSPL